MDGINKYEQILKQKLNQLEAPGMDIMWQDMHSVLDQNMPRDKKHRRILGWFFVRNNIFILSLLLISTASVTWYAVNNSAGTSTVADNLIIKSEENVEVSNESSGISSNQSISGAGKQVNIPALSVKTHNNVHADLISELNGDRNEKWILVKTQINNPGTVLKSRITAGRKIATDNTFTNKHASFSMINMVQPSTSIDIPEETYFFESGIKKLSEVMEKVQVNMEDVPHRSLITGNKLKIEPPALAASSKASKKHGPFIAGISVNYHIPVSGQEMSTVTATGNNKSIIDYLPSAFVQYHFSPKWYVQTEIQYTSPQYLQPMKMESKYTTVNANKMYEESVSLNKLYYFNIPFSIHYKATPALSIGTGLQYSYLRNSILQTEISTWENSNNNWDKTYVKKQIHVKSNPSVEKRKNNIDPTIAPTQVDTIAQSLKSSDWRVLIDVNYKWKTVTGGLRFNAGLNDYIKIQNAGSNESIRDKNQAFQLYIRYDLFGSDRKKGTLRSIFK